MTTEQRLDRVEDDLAAVRQLLASAATYAESANRGLDRAITRQDATDAQIAQLREAQTATDAQIAQLLAAQTATDAKLDRLTERVDELTTAQNRTQTHLDQMGERIDQLTAAQNRTQTQLEQMGGRVDQMSSRMDEFIFHTQRIFNQQATVLERADGRSLALEAIVQRLDRNYEEQKSQFLEFQRTTGAALERIDRVLDYLLRQQGGMK
ncbi:6-aminohexanoate hydrolase [Nostoc linckia FACHB-104]|nr:6-aminohexanoate hydrolase [Nostoc linckia FACHB-104]